MSRCLQVSFPVFVISALLSLLLPPPVAQAQDVAAGGGTEPVFSTGEVQALFTGEMSPDWLPLSVAGGNFDAFAKFGPVGLLVNVPAGNAWGKTGIWSAGHPLHPREGALDGKSTGLRFTFEPAQTDGVVVALAASDAADEWWAHDFRVYWGVQPAEKAGSAQLYIRRELAMSVETGLTAPGWIEIVLRPDGVVTARLETGEVLEGVSPEPYSQQGYRIYALAHPAAANEPARMALRDIGLFTRPAPRDLMPPFPAHAAGENLLAGGFGRFWVAHAAFGGDFARHATLTPDGLTIDIPAGQGQPQLGILSRQPVVLFDGVDETARTIVEFTLDPEGATAMWLTLTQPGWGGISGNGPSYPNVQFFWGDPPGDDPPRAELHLNPHGEGEFTTLEGDGTAPSKVSFILTPGQVTLRAEGYAPVTRPWPLAADGAAFYLYAQTRPLTADAPARLRLERIVVTSKPGPAPPVPRPAPGVAPLPMTVVFDGAPDKLWEPAQVAGGNYEAFARFEGGRFIVDVPAGNSWGKTGLLSAVPLIRLDERLRVTPTRMILTLDKSRTHQLNLTLDHAKRQDMWLSHSAWFTFFYLPARDRWQMALHVSPYNNWSREINGAWMRENWDGRLIFDIGEGWSAISVPGGPALRGATDTAPYQSYHVAIRAHTLRENAAGYLALERVELGQASPDGLDALTRWRLLDVGAFDPEGYLDDLGAAVDWSDLPEEMLR